MPSRFKPWVALFFGTLRGLFESLRSSVFCVSLSLSLMAILGTCCSSSSSASSSSRRCRYSLAYFPCGELEPPVEKIQSKISFDFSGNNYAHSVGDWSSTTPHLFLLSPLLHLGLVLFPLGSLTEPTFLTDTSSHPLVTISFWIPQNSFPESAIQVKRARLRPPSSTSNRLITTLEQQQSSDPGYHFHSLI